MLTGHGVPAKACGGMSNVLGPFPGTEYELNLLRVAISQNCTCAHRPPESTDPPCPAHTLLRDIRVLQHLIFVHRKIELFRYEEWDVDVLDHDAGGITE